MFSKIRSILFSEDHQGPVETSGEEDMEPANTSTIRISEEQPCFEVKGQSVDIYVDARRQDDHHGSSRVKVKNIVDYKWEVKKYHGRLIAVHRDGQVIAYSIKLKTGGMVRVWWQGERALIKGISNEVLDIQFAHMSSKIVLACVDEASLHIYRVETDTGKLETFLLLKVDNVNLDDVDLRSNRINWCPFVPSSADDDGDYANHLIVWSQGDTFQCLNVHLVLEAHGPGSYEYAELSEGCVQHQESKAIITAATFSPDGSTIAVGYDDGNVFFYQIYLYSKETAPRRLFNWKPHDQRPVTALLFLDDHTVRMSEGGEFWKHALTATDNNTEIKLWRCDDWSCLQRICFKPTAFDSVLDFKLAIDASSSYLVLSEQTNRALYALQIVRSDVPPVATAGGDAKSEESKVSSVVSFKSVGEFSLSSSILSLNIAGATKGKYNCGRLEDDVDECEEEANPMFGVMIQMFLVQPKSVQECQVFFQTENATAVTETVVAATERVDDAMQMCSPTTAATNVRQKSSAQINLMTPESFQSPPGKDSQSQVPNSVLNTIRMLAASSAASPGVVVVGGASGAEPRPNTETMLSYATLEEQNKSLRKSLDLRMSTTDPDPIASSTVNNSEILPSGSSSPSREVQEILSLKDEMFVNMQTSDMILDEELGANSSGGNGTEVDADEQTEIPLNIAGLGVGEEEEEDDDDNEEENHKVTANKVMEGIDAIKLYVDDDDEDNEANELCNNSGNVEWPKVPNILPDMAPMSSQAAMNGSGENNFNLKNLSSNSTASTATIATVGGATTGLTLSSTSLAVESKLDRILEMLGENSAKIGSLERRLLQWEQQQNHQQQQQQQTRGAGDVPTEASVAAAVEKRLNKSLDSHLMRCEHLIKYELDDVHKKQTKQLAAMKEQIAQTVGQMVRQQFAETVQPHLLKLVAREMENIKGMIQYEVANKLSVSDQLLRENLNYVCTNKSLMESFAAAVRSGVQHTVQVTFLEQIIPAHERASKELFRQTNELFMKGVQNYSKQVHSYMTQFQPVHDQQEKLLTTMRGLPEQFKVTNEKVINSFSAQILHEVNKDFKTLQLNVLKLIKDSVKQQQDSVLSAVRSQAQTPSVFDIQEQIRQLIAQGQVNKAFHQALISNDLALVEFTLEKTDIKEVFNPCHLEQAVLLSLIQQLSADMSAYTPTKHQYLSEAITSLNMVDPVIKEHAPKILKQLSQNIRKYIEEHPNGQSGSRFKMLLLMIAGFST